MDNTEELGTSMMTIRYKLVFVGDVFVGKTSVMNRFIKNEFCETYDVKYFLFFYLYIFIYLFHIGNNRS
jgi:GTPase SAR1 family protein